MKIQEGVTMQNERRGEVTEEILNSASFTKGAEQMDRSDSAEVVFMTEAMLKDLMNAAGKAASKATIKEMELQREKIKKQEKDLRYKKTRDRLFGYRLLKQKVESERLYTEEEQKYWRLMFLEDLMEPDTELNRPTEKISREEMDRAADFRKKLNTENALKLYEKNCKKLGKDIDERRYREMRLYYGIDDEPMDVEKLAEMFSVTQKAIYKDIGIATHIMAVYLFGTP